MLRGPYTLYIFISIGFSPINPAFEHRDPIVIIFLFNFSNLHYEVRQSSDYQKCE
jgi:hypothetical protein